MNNKNIQNIKITIINRIDSKAGSQGEIVGLKGLVEKYVKQRDMWNWNAPKKIQKRNQFAIQPQPTGIRCSIDMLTDFSQIALIDIDSKPENVNGTVLEGISDKIIENRAEIMNDSPVIMIQKSISGGIHALSFMKNKATSISDYKNKSLLLLADFVDRVNKICDVDLTEIENVVDMHNVNPCQLFFISPTPLFINKQFTDYEPDESILCKFQKEKEKENIKSKIFADNNADKYQIEINEGDMYKIFRFKTKFDHLGDEERFKVACSLKTIATTGSISVDTVRKYYYDIMKNNTIVNEDLHGMMKKFDEVMCRTNIKKYIAFNLLKKVGLHVIKC